MEETLVSVFLPYYNDQNFIFDSIKSILNQSYTNIELILLNHASSDNSREIAHSFKDNRIVHIDMDINNGAGGGILFEKMLNASKGKYIKVFCADDVMHCDCITYAVKYMENNPDKDFAFGSVRCIDQDSKHMDINFFETYGFNKKNSNIDELILYKNGIGHCPYPACIFKRSSLVNINFDKVSIMEFDMSLYLELLIAGGNIGFFEDTACYYRIHEGQISRDGGTDRIKNINKLELVFFFNIFYKIKSINILKKVFFDSKYIHLISDTDYEFIEFIVAYYFCTSSNESARISGYEKMYQLMNDNILREKIHDKFNFLLSDFRKMYSTKPMYDSYDRDVVYRISYIK